MSIHVNQETALRDVKAALDKAEKAGQWMAAVWTVKDGNIQLIERTTWQFPTGDYVAAIAQLASVIATELVAKLAPPMLPDDPLPLAIHKEVDVDSDPAQRVIDKSPARELDLDFSMREMDVDELAKKGV